MTQPIIFTLILLALVLPVLGAIVLRLLGPRLTLGQIYGASALLFVVATGSVLALARGDIPSLQIGNLSILLPITAPDDIALAPTDSQSPPDVLPPPETFPTTAGAATQASTAALPTTAQPVLTTTAVLSITAQPALTATTTLTSTATALPTATITATATVTPTATALPATATPTPVPPTPVPPTAPPAAQRTYTVKPGDTLLSIARQFNTTVQAIIDANHLTPQQADALRVGQELIIP